MPDDCSDILTTSSQQQSWLFAETVEKIDNDNRQQRQKSCSAEFLPSK